MPKCSRKESANTEVSFCHGYIQLLVLKEKLTVKKAAAISLAEFSSSALSEPLIFRLVCCGLMPVDQALSITLAEIRLTAIFHADIYKLVELERLSIEDALMLKKEEAENPVAYLSPLLNKTNRQVRKLELYESFPGIGLGCVELIVKYEFKQYRTPAENRELALLMDPQLRRYAHRIVVLEFFASPSARNIRELDLLYDHYARDYAQDILLLEFGREKSLDDDLRLESMYLKICCKIPYEDIRTGFIKHALEENGLIESAGVQRGCGQAMMFGASVPDSLARFGIFSGDNQRQLHSMKLFVERLIKTELVAVYSDVKNTPTCLRETEAMQTYILDRISELRFGILKFFTSSRTPAYSELNLRMLVDHVRQKIIAKEWALNCHDKLMSLHVIFQDEDALLPSLS